MVVKLERVTISFIKHRHSISFPHTSNIIGMGYVCITLLDVGMGCVSLDPYTLFTLFECFLAWAESLMRYRTNFKELADFLWLKKYVVFGISQCIHYNWSQKYKTCLAFRGITNLNIDEVLCFPDALNVSTMNRPFRLHFNRPFGSRANHLDANRAHLLFVSETLIHCSIM